MVLAGVFPLAPTPTTSLVLLVSLAQQRWGPLSAGD